MNNHQPPVQIWQHFLLPFPPPVSREKTPRQLPKLSTRVSSRILRLSLDKSEESAQSCSGEEKGKQTVEKSSHISFTLIPEANRQLTTAAVHCHLEEALQDITDIPSDY